MCGQKLEPIKKKIIYMPYYMKLRASKQTLIHATVFETSFLPPEKINITFWLDFCTIVY